jgi:DNA polymerase/3'-5' exonuclease PolX
MTNQAIASQLRAYARQLEAEGDNLYRRRAYRRAADVIERMDRPLSDIAAEEGRAGLAALPCVGRSLAFTIQHLIEEGVFRTRRPRAGMPA